jgi:flavin-dependent dehydrogenase
MRQAEHVIVGAGLAGLVLKHFLESDEVVIVDPAPGGYKVGESLIPELFRHPELQRLLPQVHALPSCTRKLGTTFITEGAVADFPLAPADADLSMHVLRHELERELARVWGIEPLRASVDAIDFERRVVHTSEGPIAFRGVVADCSGPAMVVASLRDEVEAMFPIHATWGYHRVRSVFDERFVDAVKGRGWELGRLDPRHGRVVPAGETRPWSPAHATVLSRAGDGLWSWQIPLRKGELLSVGVVSRHGPVSEAQYREVVAEHSALCYELEAMTGDPDEALNRLHHRDGFARRARRPAGAEFVLLADACSFSDPVYSVGAGFAVNQAITVAERLNQKAWDAQAAVEYAERVEAQVKRATQAFSYWYAGSVLEDDHAAREVQEQMLSGHLFQEHITRHYGTVLDDSELDALKDPFHIEAGGVPLDEDVRALFEAASVETLAGFELRSARRSARGLTLNLGHADGAQQIVLVEVDHSGMVPHFRAVGELRLSYLKPKDGEALGPHRLEALFDALCGGMRGQEAGWVALASS